ncbi:MAG: NUDIX domain-containing protein [Bacteroidetes bacterium]|nr:NUDIX domain-containing protein [Bacteroidota bacterium]
MGKHPFIIRVYGIYIDPDKGILVSDELVNGQYITKFPGGGLEFGEGTIDCLKREMMEETGQEFEVGEHFYTTDFFVPSAFDSNSQVISVYYFIKPVAAFLQTISTKKFDFSEHKHGAQSFRFVRITAILAEEFNLIIDKNVGKLIFESGIINN